MIAAKVIDASAAVTLKLPVAVTPPCVSFTRNESSGRCRTVWFSSASTSKTGIRPTRLADRMNMKSVRSSGVQVRTHFDPTFGCAIASRTNSTTSSSAFAAPAGAA